jgi:hypothetical protein
MVQSNLQNHKKINLVGEEETWWMKCETSRNNQQIEVQECGDLRHLRIQLNFLARESTKTILWNMKIVETNGPKHINPPLKSPIPILFLLKWT